MNQAKNDLSVADNTSGAEDCECQHLGISDSPTISIEGNGSRESHLGDGYKESDVMYTLNTIEQHGVCYGFQGQAGATVDMPIYEEATPTMVVNQVTNVIHPQSSEPILLESNQNHATIQTDGVSTTLPASMGEGGGYVPMVTQEGSTMVCAGFKPGQSADAHGLGYEEEVSVTLSTSQNQAVVCPKSSDTPIYAVEPGAASRVGGHVTEDVAPTLRADMGDNQTTVCYGISSYDSNAMKSDNPNSGIYKADTARTLDLNGGNPACNQGGMAVVQAVSTSLTDSEKQQVEDWVDAVNSSAVHQQDLIQSDLGVARTLAPGTHASGPHLTKTLVTSAIMDAPDKESVCAYGVTAKGNGDVFINPTTHTALSTGGGEPGQGYPCVLQVNTEPVSSSYVNVETEVEVRKYPVDIEKLQDCLRDHKKLSVDEIAEKLNKPKTLVAHWFRKDKYFAIPDADIWFALKELLGIETTEFDESITTFETQAGKYDMQNRIHIGDVSPTLCASSENTLYCVNSQEESTCLNPWDVQSKHIQPEDGIAESLYAAECRYGGGESYVLQNTNPAVAFTQNEREEVRDLQDVAGALSAEPGTHQQTYVAQTFKKDSHAKSSDDGQGWVPTDINDTLNAFDSGETRTPTLVVETPTTYQETTGALCAAGYSKLGTQEAMQDMFVVQSMEVFHCTTENDMVHPLKARDYKDPQIVAYSVDMGGGKSSCSISEEQSPTLATTHGGEPVVYCTPTTAVESDTDDGTDK